MSFTRISFPLVVSDGNLGLSIGADAVGQAIKDLMTTTPGRLPLSRTYGVIFDYHIPLDLVALYRGTILEALEKWIPEAEVESLEYVSDSTGNFGIWNVEIRYLEGQNG